MVARKQCKDHREEPSKKEATCPLRTIDEQDSLTQNHARTKTVFKKKQVSATDNSRGAKAGKANWASLSRRGQDPGKDKSSLWLSRGTKKQAWGVGERRGSFRQRGKKCENSGHLLQGVKKAQLWSWVRSAGLCAESSLELLEGCLAEPPSLLLPFPLILFSF